MQEREEKAESLQQELADMREKLHGLEVRYMRTAELCKRTCPVVCLSICEKYLLCMINQCFTARHCVAVGEGNASRAEQEGSGGEGEGTGGG